MRNSQEIWHSTYRSPFRFDCRTFLMIEMNVKQLGVNAHDGHPVVLLKEKNGSRIMPIWVGPAEFQAIAMAVNKVVPSRPMTHDLMDSVVTAMGRQISRLDITEIADATFLA